MKYVISKELNDALESLLKKLSIETIGNIWDAWRTKDHRDEMQPPVEGSLEPANENK